MIIGASKKKMLNTFDFAKKHLVVYQNSESSPTISQWENMEFS